MAEIRWDLFRDPPEPAALDQAMSDEERMIYHGWMNPTGFSGLGVFNTRAWRLAEIPSTNGHGTADGVAKVYAALAQGGSLRGVRVLGKALLEEAIRPHAVGPCPVLKREASFALGFQTSLPNWPFGPNPKSFGHMGTGCSLGFADPGRRIGFGYVMSHIIPRKRSPRCDALVSALYRALGSVRER